MSRANSPFIKAEMQRLVRNSPGTQKFFRNAALAKLVSYKEELIDEYIKHNITQEIIAGNAAENISNTLGGEGNLFSFIGFENSQPNPAEQVPEFLKKNITLETTGKYQSDEKNTTIQFAVIAPTPEDFEAAFPMPWEPGCWLFKISDGISGLGEYIFHKFFNKGRSKSGLQMEYQTRDEEYKPKPYFNKMWKKFLRRIK